MRRVTAEKHEAQVSAMRAERETAQAALNPLQRRVLQLEAAEATHQAELERVSLGLGSALLLEISRDVYLGGSLQLVMEPSLQSVGLLSS